MRARACVAALGVCVVRARLMAKTPMPLPKLGLNSTSSFSRSWSLPVAATVADHIASVALARSAVTVAVPGRTFISGGSFILQKFGVNQRTIIRETAELQRRGQGSLLVHFLERTELLEVEALGDAAEVIPSVIPPNRPWSGLSGLP